MTLLAQCVLLTAIVAVPTAEGEPDLQRQDITRRGKAATAFLETTEGSSATAFSVDSSGLFVTSAHVVGDVGDRVELVLNAGEPDRRAVKARVIRRSEAADLALLRAADLRLFPVLPLGSPEAIEELTELVAFGFPFGRALTTGANDEPAISVNLATVSSVSRHEGELSLIQLASAVNPGHSGGPLLDAKGRVAGVIVGRVEAETGAGIDLAVPANLVKAFLEAPDISIELPKIGAAGLNAPAEFRARVLPIIPSMTPDELRLVLSSGTIERTFTMTRKGQVFAATAVPVPADGEPLPIELSIEYADGAVTGMVSDHKFSVGSESLMLNNIRQLSLVGDPRVELADGRIVSGKISGLDQISITIGGQSVQFTTGGAIMLRVEEDDETSEIEVTVLAFRAGKEIGRSHATLGSGESSEPDPEKTVTGEDTNRDADEIGSSVRGRHRFNRPEKSGEPTTYFQAVSTSSKDWVGQGKRYSFSEEEMTIRHTPRGVSINGGGPGKLNAEFGGRLGRYLEVGEYHGAERCAFSGTAPGIDVSGYGRGCNKISGEFVVWEIETKSNNVLRLAIDFVQRCEETGPPLVGKVRYNSNFK